MRISGFGDFLLSVHICHIAVGDGMCTKTIDLVYYLFRGTGVALVVIIAKKLTGDGLDVCRTIFEKAVFQQL